MAKFTLYPTFKRINRFLTGKTKAGQVFMGAIDGLPVANLLNAYRAAVKNNENGNLKEILSDTITRVDGIRLGVSVVVSLLILNEIFEIEQVEKFLSLVNAILGLF